MATFRPPVAALLALLVPGGFGPSASALTPPMACRFVPELGRFLNPDEAEPPTAQSVLPDTFANGIVYFEVADLYGTGDRSRWLVVQQCGTPAGLVLQIDPGRPALRARFDEMIFGTAPYTLRQIAAAMSDMGGQVRLGKIDLGSCPCDHQRFFYGR
ncbi:hypothetical protein [Roseivivax sp. CAU 1753]